MSSVGLRGLDWRWRITMEDRGCEGSAFGGVLGLEGWVFEMIGS
jgi:hypothetical protein